MNRLLFLPFCILATAARAQTPPPPPPNPCAHGSSQVMIAGIDPVQQACALNVAGQTIGEQAQQIVALRAALAVTASDLAALKKQAEPAPPPKK